MTYVRTLKIEVDEKEYLKSLEEWGLEPPKTEKELAKKVARQFDVYSDSEIMASGYERFPFAKEIAIWTKIPTKENK